MAVRASSPWWLSAGLALGLLMVFIGERVLGHHESLRMTFTVLGLALVGGATAWRVWVISEYKGDRRRVESTALLCYLGVIVALIGYFTTTDTGMGLFGLEEEKAIARFDTSMTVLWVIIMVVSVVPLLMIETSLGISNRTGLRAEDGLDEAAVETFRVREMASSGLTIGLAMCFLMVTCNIANERNKRWDVSYFKTSGPGTATVNMAGSLNEDLKVLLFFPEVNEVQEEVKGYFQELNDKAGGKLTIEQHDRMASPTLAKDHKVNRDGTIVLVRGDKSEKFTVKTDIKQARRTELREFDEKVQKALMKVIREKKVAYFTTGHGELNDPGEDRPLVAENPALTKASMVKNWLRTLNYDAKDLGIGKPIPEDASVVIVLAPMTPLLEEEYQRLDEYLAGGGAVLFALDPVSTAGLGVLEGRLGVRFNRTALADDKEFLRRRGLPTEHEFILTNQFSAHASVTTASRGRARSGIVLFKSGSLEDAPFSGGDSAERKRTYTVRSINTTWRDTNGNLAFDKDAGEKRSRYNVVAAIEDPTAAPEVEEGQPAPRGMRAVVFADGELFSDGLMHPQAGLPLVQALVIDSIKWLGGEEEFIGETKTEKDVRIVHTKNEDAVWFYSTIVGAPVLVLGFGVLSTRIRRRSNKRRAS